MTYHSGHQVRRAYPRIGAVLAGALLLAFCAASSVRAAGAQGAEIQWAGLFRASVVGTMEQPDTAIGRTNQLSGVEKLEATTTVPARLGVSFGLEYRLTGDREGDAATIQIVVVPPKAGLLNPATGRRVHRESWRPSIVLVGATAIVGYKLEHDWEVVPGLWRFEIWQAGRKLAQQSFCLVPEPGSADSEKLSGEDRCHSAATA
jgi:Domain of unknown function (DUF3859)